MITKIFRPLGAGGGAFLLAAASALSYLLGLIRDRMFVETFGSTASTDSYFKAFLLPDTLLTICITGALLGLVIPLYVQAQKISKEEGEKVFGTFFFVLNGFYLMTAIFCVMFLSPLLSFLFPETTAEQFPILVKITSILIFSNLFFALSNFLGHFLLAHKRFLAYSLAPLLYNLGIILGIWFGHQSMGIYAAAWGALLGSVLHCALRLLDVCLSPHTFHFSLDVKNLFFRDLLKGIFPKVISLLALQIGFYFFARMGDGMLGAGNYSAFQYARNLQSFAVSLFGIALATAVFPFLSEFASEKKMGHFLFRLEKSLRQILFLALPAAVGMALLSVELVSFVYGNRPSNVLTIMVLIPLALTIPFESINHLLVRAFHGLKSTILPMISSLFFLVVLISVSSILVTQFDFGVEAFGIGYLAGFIFQIIFLFFWLPKFSGSFPWKDFWQKFWKTIFLTIVMGGAVFFIHIALAESNFILRFLIPMTMGGSIFLGGAFLMKAPEVMELPVWKWIGKREETK